jgi:hypothetical protein
MNDSKGGKIKMTKEDLDKISCLKLFREKTSGVKNNEEKNENGQQTENENQTHREENKDGKNEKAEQFKRMLRKELNEAIKTTKLKEKLNNKEKRYQNLQDIRNKGKESMKEGFSKDYNNVYKRKNLYNELMDSYEQKIYLKEKQKKENFEERIKNEKDEKKKQILEKKMNDLKKKIEYYEKKEVENKEKINKIFKLDDKGQSQQEQQTEEKNGNKNNNKKKEEELPESQRIIQQRLDELEGKFEMEKYRREMALLRSMDRQQNKINHYIELNEKRQEKIKNALIKSKQLKEEKRSKNNMHFDDAKKRIKEKEKLDEEKRKKLLNDIEKKNLRSYVIKKEKKKIMEEKIAKSKMQKDQAEALKLKLEKIINSDTTVEGEEKINMINNLIK